MANHDYSKRVADEHGRRIRLAALDGDFDVAKSLIEDYFAAHVSPDSFLYGMTICESEIHSGAVEPHHPKVPSMGPALADAHEAFVFFRGWHWMSSRIKRVKKERHIDYRPVKDAGGESRWIAYCEKDKAPACDAPFSTQSYGEAKTFVNGARSFISFVDDAEHSESSWKHIARAVEYNHWKDDPEYQEREREREHMDNVKRMESGIARIGEKAKDLAAFIRRSGAEGAPEGSRPSAFDDVIAAVTAGFDEGWNGGSEGES